jgi:PBSX family phage terminase large subunit
VFKLTEKQKEALNLLSSPATNILLYGGSRSAKTFLLIYAIIGRAIKAPGSTHSVFRWRLSDLIRSVVFGTYLEVMKICYPGLQAKCKFDKQRNVLFLYNGSKVWFAGLEDNKGSQKVLGTGVSTIFFNEASEIPFHAYTISRTRLSEKNILKPVFLIDENPPANKMHWTYKMFFENVNPSDGSTKLDTHRYAKLQMNPIDNLDNIPDDYISELEQLPERERKRFLLGEFGDGVEGGVYSDCLIDAKDQGRVVEELKPYKEFPVHAVFDLGWNDSTAFWIVQFAPNKILFLDYYEKRQADFRFFMFEIWNRNWRPQIVYLPHDSLKTHQETPMLNMYTVASRIGSDPTLDDDMHFSVVKLPKTQNVGADINVTRMMFTKCYFDKNKCDDGLNVLRNFKYDYNERDGIYSQKPREDWTKHGADAFRYAFAAFYQQGMPKPVKKRAPGDLLMSDLVGFHFGTKDNLEY